MFKEIKLDDRTYQEIRDEAVANIVRHCPEWTNHNSSDPGITIIELLSSMTEDMLRRLNRVPDKNYFAFLDLIGIHQRLPRPSSAYVTFSLTDGYQASSPRKNTVFLPKGSIVTTEAKGESDAIPYQTLNDTYISNVKLLNLYSKTFNSYRDRDEIVDNMPMFRKGEPFSPFGVEGASDNIMQIYLSSMCMGVLRDSANVTLIFRLPTTMRLHKISDDFLESIRWEFFDGASWQYLQVLGDFFFTLDDQDADILSVTFKGGNDALQPWILEQFGPEERYYIRGTLTETPQWLGEFAVYEMSVATQSYPMGILPATLFHNYEELNLNNDFYPFGSRPKVDDKLQEEILYIKSPEAFAISGTSISISLKHSLNPEYITPKGSENLKLAWEYAGENNTWGYLKITDTTKNFSQDGTIEFEIPGDIRQIKINGEEGYWVRCRILSGDYGSDETNEYNEKSASIVTTPSTLRPPLLSEMRISYTKPRKDIRECYTLNNFRYTPLEFIENRPVTLFDFESDREEALYFGFDSFLSEERLCMHFDIDNDTTQRNILKEQRVIEWQLLLGGKWVSLEHLSDTTEGLTSSGDVEIVLPKIENLERYTLYIEEYERMWIKARIRYSSLRRSVDINTILLNSVEVIQQESFYDEHLGTSDGLPGLNVSLNDRNLSQPPVIFVGEHEYKAVERFIDHGRNDRVFRFNGIDGIIEFGDGEYGTVPPLGEEIVAREYSITRGKEGNVKAGEITLLMEPINYIDSVTNPKPSLHGEDGDTLEELKKHAPAVLKTMDRAITLEDYELLAQNFSPAIKKAKCISRNGDLIVIPVTETILEDMGFINKRLTDELYSYLKERSILTVDPVIVPPGVATLNVHLKLTYTIENYNVTKAQLRERLLENAKRYFDPFKGYRGEGFPLGKHINKSDFYTILYTTDNNIFISEIAFRLNGSRKFTESVNLPYNSLVLIESVVIEELVYDV